MLKKSVSVFLIYVIFLLSCFSKSAQTPNRFSEEQIPQMAEKGSLEKLFAKDIRKTDELNPINIDVARSEKDSFKEAVRA